MGRARASVVEWAHEKIGLEKEGTLGATAVGRIVTTAMDRLSPAAERPKHHASEPTDGVIAAEILAAKGLTQVRGEVVAAKPGELAVNE
jgi:hypothetical protein